MLRGSILSVACVLCVGAFAAEPASAPVPTQTSSPRLDNAHCDAYRNTSTAARTPRDLGTVVLRLDVSAQGQVLASEIVEHTTTHYFAHIAQENFSKCSFSPAQESGTPVKGTLVLRLAFGEHPLTPNNATCPAPFSRDAPPAVGPMVSTRIRVRFTKAGRVASVDVLQPSGVPALDEAAVKAYLQCHFDPEAANQPTFQEEWVTTMNWSS